MSDGQGDGVRGRDWDPSKRSRWWGEANVNCSGWVGPDSPQGDYYPEKLRGGAGDRAKRGWI
jgi:hypothetical protein